VTVEPGGRLTTANETPLWLRSGKEDVFAILTEPALTETALTRTALTQTALTQTALTRTAEANGTGVILLHSGTHSMSAAVGRMWVRMGRELAADGAYVLRLDFSGSGDSSGLFERRGDGQPVTDVAAGLDELVERGVRRVAVVTQCYSAVPALLLALDRPEVRSLVLLSPPFTWVSKGQTTIQAGGAAPLGDALRATLNSRTVRLAATDAEYRKWLLGRARRRALRSARAMRRDNTAVPADSTAQGSPAGEPDRVLLGKEWVGALARNNVDICVLYGAQDRMYDDFVAAREGGFDEVLAYPSVEVIVDPVGSIHSLRDAEAQELVATRVHAAVGSLAGHSLNGQSYDGQSVCGQSVSGQSVSGQSLSGQSLNEEPR
jgi:pimeloyl-ACP methyl ester carboxylesterase